MNRFNLTQILADKFAQASKKDIVAVLSVAFIAFVSFGQFAIDIAYNNDGIGRFTRGGGKAVFELAPYLDGFTKGRWAYPFFVNTFNGMIALPYFVTIISTFLFLMISFVIWKLFDIKQLSQRVISGGLICSSPLFVHYFFYTGDGEVYASGLLLVSYGIYLFTSLKKRFNALGLLLIVIGLACYPALFGYCMGLAFLYIIYLFFQHEELKPFLAKAAKIFVLSGLSLILYFAITKLMIYLLDVKMTSYKNASDISPGQILKNLPNQFALTYSLFADFWSKAHLVVKGYLVATSALLIYQAFRKNVQQAPVMILLLALSIPLVFVMYLITYESKPYEGFQFGFIPLLALLHIPLIRFGSTWMKQVILIVPLCLIFTNMKETNQIIMKYRLNCEASRMLTFNIAHELQKHPEFDPTKKIAIIGNVRENDNYKQSPYVPETRVLNGMHFPAAFSGSNIHIKIRNQLQIQGYRFRFVTAKQNRDVQAVFEGQNVPEFPKAGSIFTHEGLFVINMGLEEGNQE